MSKPEHGEGTRHQLLGKGRRNGGAGSFWHGARTGAIELGQSSARFAQAAGGPDRIPSQSAATPNGLCHRQAQTRSVVKP